MMKRKTKHYLDQHWPLQLAMNEVGVPGQVLR